MCGGPQRLARHIVRGLMKTRSCTSHITKLVQIHAEIDAMNESKFYDQSTNVGNENEKATPALPQKERFSASSSTSKHMEKKKYEKKEDAADLSRSSVKTCGSSWCSSADYQIDCHNKGSKGVNALRPVSTHITEVLNFGTYRLNKRSQ